MGVCLTQELVERYTAGDCSDDEQRTVEIHLSECESCRQQVEFTRSHLTDSSQSTWANGNSKTLTYIPGDETYGRPDEYATVSMPETPVSADKHAHTAGTPSETVFEGYRILEQLPAGGQAIVYKALQEATKRVVALKVLLQGPHASVRAQYRFEREVDLAASLRHPNIVTIYDSGITKGQYYFAMEYIEGQPLDKYVHSEKLSTRQTMELFNKVCSGVAYAHQRGVIHRDLKPGNIFVDADGQPHILDFGLAKLVDGSEQTSPEAVMTSIPGKVIGTLAFMSPEQASAQPNAIDVRTDVYSIGMILYRILTGEFPYDISGSMLAILRNIQEAEPTRPSSIVPRFNSEVEAILLRALAKEPTHRYQSAAHLQQDIDGWLKGMPIAARSDSSIYLLRKIITRHYYTSTVLALLLVIIFGFSYFYYQLYSRLRRTNVTLKSTVQSLNKETAQYAGLALKTVFSHFLEAWHADQPDKSRFIARHFTRGSREANAALFLLDPKPVAEKTPEFRKKLGKGQACFAEFIIGEHYLKNGNRAEATEAYKRSLSYKSDLKKNRWLAVQVESRLYELSNKNQRQGSLLTVDD